VVSVTDPYGRILGFLDNLVRTLYGKTKLDISRSRREASTKMDIREMVRKNVDSTG
jgi:hypothetical protein